MIKTLITDDDARFRLFIKGILSQDLEIDFIGEAENGQEAMLKAGELRPDLVLMDVRMPGMNGLESTRLLKKAMPDLKVIMLTNYNLEEYRDAAKAAGADDYILKKCINMDLIPAIKEIFKCKTTWSGSQGRPGVSAPNAGD
ncbi:MAG: response regulator transcription factor [Thermodesulfobacteriota bacterium]